jgi:tetratricopeptide (TPR) repeat protein
MIDIDEKNPESYYGIGELFYIVGDYEKSIPFFDKAIELYIEQDSMVVYDAFYYKGIIYYRMNNYDEALKYLEEVQKIDIKAVPLGITGLIALSIITIAGIGLAHKFSHSQWPGFLI